MNGHQRQKEQSGRMLEEALFSLMEEKRYGQITVSEIVKRADVSRRTFYRLYKEKDEVLRRYFGRLCQEYCRQASVLKAYDIPQIAREYFRFWYSYREFLLLMHKQGMDEMLYYEIARASVDVVTKRMEKSPEKTMSEIEYFAAYSSGGFLLLLQRWIMTGMQETPEEYARAVGEALLKFVRPTGKWKGGDSL